MMPRSWHRVFATSYFQTCAGVGSSRPRHTNDLSEPLTAWAQWISPETLLSQVYNTAPYLEAHLPEPERGRLIEMGGTPDGFLRVLRSWENIRRADLSHAEQLQDYFAL